MLQITNPNQYITITTALTRTAMLFLLGYNEHTLATAQAIGHMRRVNSLVSGQHKCELVSVDGDVATVKCRLYGNTVTVPASYCVVRG